jgi:starch phosphorylase
LDFKQDFERRLSEKYGRSVPDSHITERYDIFGEMVRDYAGYNWRNCRENIVKNNGANSCIYFSMEFLMGRLLVLNMQNLGIYHVAKDGLAELGIDINELEDMESDAGARQWRLRPLAACFMDSIASLATPDMATPSVTNMASSVRNSSMASRLNFPINGSAMASSSRSGSLSMRSK